MSTDNVAEILDGFVEVSSVPEGFADFVAERVAARPSPEPQPDPFQTIVAKLDEILAILKEGRQ